MIKIKIIETDGDKEKTICEDEVNKMVLATDTSAMFLGIDRVNDILRMIDGAIEAYLINTLDSDKIADSPGAMVSVHSAEMMACYVSMYEANIEAYACVMDKLDPSLAAEARKHIEKIKEITIELSEKMVAKNVVDYDAISDQLIAELEKYEKEE